MRRRRRSAPPRRAHGDGPNLLLPHRAGWRRSCASPPRRPGSRGTATSRTAARSVHLRTLPEVPAAWLDAALAERWESCATLRRVVTGALELERAEKRIGSSLQAAVEIIRAGAATRRARAASTSPSCASPRPARWRPATPPDGAFTLPDVPGYRRCRGRSAAGRRCERCWRVLPEVGHVAGHADLCRRCAEVLDRGAVPAMAAAG